MNKPAIGNDLKQIPDLLESVAVPEELRLLRSLIGMVAEVRAIMQRVEEKLDGGDEEKEEATPRNHTAKIVLQVMPRGEDMGFFEIFKLASKLADVSETMVSNALSRMAKRGEITKLKRGRYRLEKETTNA